MLAVLLKVINTCKVNQKLKIMLFNSNILIFIISGLDQEIVKVSKYL